MSRKRLTSPKLTLSERDNLVRLRFTAPPPALARQVLSAAGFEELVAFELKPCPREVHWTFVSPWTERALELARELEA